MQRYRPTSAATEPAPPCAPPFSQAELSQVLDKLKTGRSPGPDGLPNELLKNLSQTGRRHFLELQHILERSDDTGMMAISGDHGLSQEIQTSI